MANILLHEFITLNREELIRRCRATVAVRTMSPPTDAEISHGVPLFLDQLVDALRLGLSSSPQVGSSAALHGHQRLLQGFSVSQVVQDYGDVCQSVTGLAMEMNAPISTDDFRTLNRCLDDAIAGAVTEYGLGRNQSTLDGMSARGSERLGFLAHEVRSLADTAIIAFDVLKTGNVGVAGSTGAVLRSTITSIRALMGRAIAEVRSPERGQNRESFLVSELIDDVRAAATVEASSKDLILNVMPVADDVAIEADRQVLGAVVNSLLQNAFRFTEPCTTVTLRVGATAERVLIEVMDECGGLPGGNLNELLRPFQDRDDGDGSGLGLAFSRWGVEANDGRISARNLPEKGCVFTVDLPRLTVGLATRRCAV